MTPNPIAAIWDPPGERSRPEPVLILAFVASRVGEVSDVVAVVARAVTGAGRGRLTTVAVDELRLDPTEVWES